MDAGPTVRSHLVLPPGFRFHPTDEELVIHYLKKKAASCPLPVPIIAEIDLYKFDPWELPAKANFGEHEWYFFSPRDRKYPNGSRPNRAAASGYWKATGTDKPILTCGGTQKIGVKKALVFYRGKPPKGIKTNWIMHEYRLTDSSARPSSFMARKSLRLDDSVLCRVYKKSAHTPRMNVRERDNSSCVDDVLASLPDIGDSKLGILPRLDSFGGLIMGGSESFLEDIMTEPSSEPETEHSESHAHKHSSSSVASRSTYSNMNPVNSSLSSQSTWSTPLPWAIPKLENIEMDSSIFNLKSAPSENEHHSTAERSLMMAIPAFVDQQNNPFQQQQMSPNSTIGDMENTSFKFPFADSRLRF